MGLTVPLVATAPAAEFAKVAAGRRLKLAPAWDEDARLCFDAASGDYWVLTTATAAALERLLAGAPAGEGASLADSTTLASLIDAGLLEAMGASGP